MQSLWRPSCSRQHHTVYVGKTLGLGESRTHPDEPARKAAGLCAHRGVCVGGGGESGLLRIGTSLLNSRQNSGSAPKIWSLDCDPRRVVYVCHLEQVP
jgi:hypothetical protein